MKVYEEYMDHKGSLSEVLALSNAMVSGFVANGLNKSALHLVSQLRRKGMALDVYTLSSALKACMNLHNFRLAFQIHALVFHHGHLFDSTVGSILVDLYVKCRNLEDALRVFNGLPHKDVVTWAGLISACVQEGLDQLAFFSVYGHDKIRQVHARSIKIGFEREKVMLTSLIDMYSKCGQIDDSLAVFKTAIFRDTACWTDPSHTQFTRIMMNKENVNDEMRSSQVPSMRTSINQKPRETLFPLPKQHNPFEASSSRGDFRIVTSESLLNNPRGPYLESRSYAPSPELNGGESQPNPLRHFFDDWPKGRSNRLTISWPDVEEMQPDGTQLSISIPMASSDFSSSSLSPVHEKAALSPFKSSRETETIQMGLGVGGILNEMSQREASWVPISWEPSMGGPLGEVLNKTSNASVDHNKNTSSSSLNLMTEGWDSSPRLASSPTGVLQKTTFASLSGSTGSSPRAETHRTNDSTTSMCDDLLGSTLVNSTSIPTL